MTSKSVRTIGEVINLLRDEFPEVSVSKVRFLETKGMIRPARSQSGYREFTADDVSRIRYILQQQRDHFLPLKVIKSKLTAWERGEEPSAGSGPTGPPPETYFASTRMTLTAEELSRAAGLTTTDLERLVEHDVIHPREDAEDNQVFQEGDLPVARAAGRLLSHGLEPRHLRTLRLGAERTTQLLYQLTSPLLRHGSPESRQRAAEVLADCAQAARDVQEAILREELLSLLED